MKSSLLWLFTLAIQLYKLFRLGKSAKFYKSLYHKAKRLQAITTTELYDRVTKNIYTAGEYVLCKGRVIGSEICQRRIKPNLTVIYSELFLEKVIQFENKTNLLKSLIEKIRPSFLKIVDHENTINIYETGLTKMISKIQVSPNTAVICQKRLVVIPCQAFSRIRIK